MLVNTSGSTGSLSVRYVPFSGKMLMWEDFPGGALVKNLPANAGTWVQALVQEDPTCCGATKPVCHNY